MMEVFICYSSFILRSWYPDDPEVLGFLGVEFNFNFDEKKPGKGLDFLSVLEILKF